MDDSSQGCGQCRVVCRAQRLEIYDEQALRRDTRQVGLWSHMAGVLLRLRYSGDALFAFELAERLGCQEASCYRGKGDALMDCARYRQAVDAYRDQAERLMAQAEEASDHGKDLDAEVLLISAERWLWKIAKSCTLR